MNHVMHSINTDTCTDMCIFTVKSVIKYYTKQKSAVYTCFLDVAKAFDSRADWE